MSSYSPEPVSDTCSSLSFLSLNSKSEPPSSYSPFSKGGEGDYKEVQSASGGCRGSEGIPAKFQCHCESFLLKDEAIPAPS